MSATATEFRTPVFNLPREYLGQARAFRAQVAAEDKAADAAMLRISKASRLPLSQGKIARPEHLQDIARRWENEVPTAGRLRLEVELSPRRLVVRDLRMSAIDQRVPGWTAQEEAIAIYLVGVAVKRRAYEPIYAVLGVVSQHALARRMQRAFDSSREAICADLIRLAAAVNDPLAGRFLVRVPEGAWKGRLQLFPDGTSALEARTFISSGDLE